MIEEVEMDSNLVIDQDTNVEIGPNDSSVTNSLKAGQDFDISSVTSGKSLLECSIVNSSGAPDEELSEDINKI